MIEMPPYSDQQIPILSVEWSGVTEEGGGPMVTTFGDMTVAKAFDLLSPQLLADYAMLKAIPELRIELSLPNAVASYVLGTAYISGIGATTLGAMPLETVRFAYQQVTVSTTDHATNTTTTACWNIQTNSVC